MINLDQTSSKHIQVSSNTMEKKGVTNVPTSGIRNLRNLRKKVPSYATDVKRKNYVQFAKGKIS